MTDNKADRLGAAMKNTIVANPSIFSAKNMSILALVFQQVALVLMIRHSKVRKTEESATMYVTSTVVVAAECLKLVLNLTLELVLVKQQSFVSIARGFVTPESLKLTIPALLYVIQNNVLFVALGNLSVPVYQVTNQGKLLTTAVCSRLMLNKQISNLQYVSLFVLAAGVSIVNLSSMDKKGVASDDQNQFLGLIAVGLSCVTSGASGVYFEKILKSTEEISVYMRNCQLAVWSILLGLIPVFGYDFPTIQQHGFFAGYDAVVVGVICCQAGTGLIVALVMKYADSIWKGFATSVAVVVATLMSIFIWNARVDHWFVIGAAMVMWAVQLYSKKPAATKKKESEIETLENV
mmetsp:Transcript_17745/g.32090  ORF Transcript_17745/g.32090 Transcript_17745/m.32090 type:complete len:350 (-) Transcript_17745:493-1542(-)|eukprot:CAMPEP_0198283678 /NCGR_PEP_ID=MMETSP1449-20131203/3250_1 /TAXON_ID=420275 /ORGANISM="Attheya septentrionalis, Strain CCMP2084" /LENGTH=349 /DNA_ID=CAMNT_0043980403 /DNA_START=62 /DNA_END=1111 /DNA_ORIENTATION=-